MAAACAPLEPIEIDGRCGNRILEPEVGEDCDGAAACRAPGAPSECRFTCEMSACPDGFVCGADRVCRAPREDPRSAFGPPRELFLDAFDVEVADVDGDGIDDLALLRPDELEVRFGDLAGDYTASFRLNVDSSAGFEMPGVDSGDLDGDGLADLVVEQFGGPLILRGRPSRELEQVTRPLRQLPSGPVVLPFPIPHLRLLSVRVVDGGGARQPVMIEPRGDRVAIDLPLDVLSGPIADLGVAASILPRSIGVADTSTDGGRVERIALAGLEAREVAIVEVACTVSGVDPFVTLDCVSSIVDRVELVSPIGAGTFFADVDGDGVRDLIAGVLDGTSGVPGLEVAFGMGDGRFCAAPPAACLPQGVGRARPLDVFIPFDETMPVIPDLLLFAGDLDGEAPGDFSMVSGLTGNTVVFGRTLALDGGRYRLDGSVYSASLFTAQWNGFVAGDFNRDGITDFAASRSVGRSVDAFLGTDRGLFSIFSHQVGATVEHMGLGDFDGDLHDDLVLAEGQAGVSVLFGSPQGLSERVVMSTATNVADVVPADVRSASGVDHATDLLVVTATIATGPAGMDLYATLLHGSSRRRMVAPLNFISGARRLLELPARIVVGRFGADAFEDLLVTTISFDGGIGPPDRLWLVEGDETQSQLPRPLSADPSCDELLGCGVVAEPEIANFDPSDPDDDLLLTASCTSLPEVWLVGIAADRLECRRVPELGGGSSYAPLDLDLDGVSEVAFASPSGEYQVARFAGGAFVVDAYSTEDGAFLTRMEALPNPGGPPWIVYVADFVPHIGVLDGRVLRGEPITAGGVTEPPIFDGGPGPPGPLPGIVGPDIDVLDVTGDGLFDLLLYGTYLVEQIECDPLSRLFGACGAAE
jgi:hypothetical protein